ncbi:hypothetical protein Hanom_Chr05g00470931 [Helianthus anomalus]
MNMQVIINGNSHSFHTIWTLKNVLTHLPMLINMHHFIFFNTFAAFPFLHEVTQSNHYGCKKENTSKRNKNDEYDSLH